MGTKLTTPEVRPDITHHAVVEFKFLVPHVLNQAQDDIIISKDDVYVRYEVVKYNANREVVEQSARTVKFPQWPNAFKTAAQDVYALIEQDARNQGLLGDGADEPINT